MLSQRPLLPDASAQGLPYRVLVFARQRPPVDKKESPKAGTPRTPTRIENYSGTTTPTGRGTPQPAREAGLPPPKVEGSQVSGLPSAPVGHVGPADRSANFLCFFGGCRALPSRDAARACAQVHIGNKVYAFDGAFDGSARQQARRFASTRCRSLRWSLLPLRWPLLTPTSCRCSARAASVRAGGAARAYRCAQWLFGLHPCVRPPTQFCKHSASSSSGRCDSWSLLHYRAGMDRLAQARRTACCTPRKLVSGW